MAADPDLSRALLAELAAHPDGLALPRLCKRLGVRMSVLLRTLAWLGDSEIGGKPGPDWVRVIVEDERSLAVLTAGGRARAGEL